MITGWIISTSAHNRSCKLQKEDAMNPREAIETFCHTSRREWAGTTYTIQDARAGAYNGCEVKAELVFGEYQFFWV